MLTNATTLYETLNNTNILPDVVTDQTSAHDIMSYVPMDMSYKDAVALRESDPKAYHQASLDTMTRSAKAMVEMQNRGAIVFDYGNNIRQRAFDNGYTNAFDFPGFVPAFIRPLFCEGKGPFRWVALSRRPRRYLSHRPSSA